MRRDNRRAPPAPMPTIDRRELIMRTGAFATATMLLPHSSSANTAQPCFAEGGDDTVVAGTRVRQDRRIPAREHLCVQGRSLR